jgi:[acyl-carrier-protein] S-malonyltransferase
MAASNIMFVFPGQGSQYVGMGSDLCAEFPLAKQIYAQANEVLGYDITSLSFSGPEEELGLTRHTQPALLTHQVVCLEVFRELTDGQQSASLAGGHSLGEYTALVAAGVISFEDCLRLVKVRGELMGQYGEGGMLALGLTIEEARPLASQFYCQVGGCNLPEQTVLGGAEEDLDALEQALPEIYPKKRSVRLKTEGAFHTYLMVAAAREFRVELDRYEFKVGDFDVLSDFTGAVHDPSPKAIRTRLFFQLFNPVRWVTCMQTAARRGVDCIIEFGGGIGKGDDPSDKKPNLQSIIAKNLRALDHEAEYVPAINVATLKAAAEAFGS